MRFGVRSGMFPKDILDKLETEEDLTEAMKSHPIDSVPEDTSIPVHKDSSIPEIGRVPLGNIPTTNIETKHPSSNDNIEVQPVKPGLGLMEGMLRCKVCKHYVKQSDMDRHRQKHNTKIISRDSSSLNSQDRSE